MSYNIKISSNINELKLFLKEKKIDIIILDLDILEESMSSFLTDLNMFKRDIGIIILYKNEFFKFNFNRFKYLKIAFVKKPFLLNSIINCITQITSVEHAYSRKNSTLNIPNLERTNKTKHIYNAIIKVVKNDLNILISGETGTGKHQIATTINNLTSKKQLLEINFTDYKNNNFLKLLLKEITSEEFLSKKNLKNLEISNCILISNIDAMDKSTQNLLFEELKQKKQNLIPLFKNKRVIALTNKNIKNSLRNDNFSNELFYQLDMYNIFTIPLRDRAEDIPALVKSFISEHNQKNRSFFEIEDNAFYAISNYIWPGNTKQMKNFILRCIKISDSNIINEELINNELQNEFKYQEKSYLENWKTNFRDVVSKNIRGYLNNNNKKINSGLYYKMLKEYEKPLLLEVLKFTNNNQLLSSELLGINRNTLRKKMADYEIEVIKKTND